MSLPERKALVVGINYYQNISPLFGCVADAQQVKNVLALHGNGERRNFTVTHLLGSGPDNAVSRPKLKEGLKRLFADACEVALFYFAGHGHIETTGGYLCTSENQSGDDGIPLGDVLVMAKNSRATNKVIVLDSCFSGIAGNPPSEPESAHLEEGITILTASTKDQYATEANGCGLFTSLFVDALNGAAANLVGDITPGSVYAHIDQSLGPWGQRPIFKTNVRKFVSLREVPAPISIADLRRLTELFPQPGFELRLDPSFEPEMRGRGPKDPPPNPENCKKFAILQKYNRVNLLIPVSAASMWHAAMKRKKCRLTPLGEHYRRLAEHDMI